MAWPVPPEGGGGDGEAEETQHCISSKVPCYLKGGVGHPNLDRAVPWTCTTDE